MTVCFAVNGSRKNYLKETAVLEVQFGELTISGTQEGGCKMVSLERLGNVLSYKGKWEAGALW